MFEQEDTSGFYMFDGGIVYAPTFVHSPDFYIDRGEKDTYTYPVGGWYWFDSKEEARAFFGLPLEDPPPPSPLDIYNSMNYPYDPNGGF